MVIETNRNGGFSQQILEYHQDIIWDIHQGDRFETIEYRGHFPQITMATVWDFLHVKRNLYFLFFYIGLSHYLQGFNHPRWCRISSTHRMLVFDVSFCEIRLDVEVLGMRQNDSPASTFRRQERQQISFAVPTRTGQGQEMLGRGWITL